jgi:hypothetical protein
MARGERGGDAGGHDCGAWIQGRNADVRQLTPALLLMVFGLAGLATASLMGVAPDGRYVVIAPPWSSVENTMSLIGAADGGVLEPGRFPNIMIAASERSDFPGRARAHGAWLVVRPPLAAGCFTPSRKDAAA